MAIKIDNVIFAQTAYSYKDSRIPYSKLDCQAFVERVLRDCGIGHDWRGSNHMWRDAVDWRGSIDDCIKAFGAIPSGAWVFTVKHDGGEKPRGYNDNMGNAAHVGIFISPEKGVMHSTAGGVQCTPWPDAKRWTHVGLCKMISYPVETANDTIATINACIAALETIKRRMIQNDL